MKVLKHLLDVCVQCFMDLVELRLLLFTEHSLYLVEKVIDLACDILGSLVVCKLHSSLILANSRGVVEDLMHVELLVWDAVEEGVHVKEKHGVYVF